MLDRFLEKDLEVTRKKTIYLFHHTPCKLKLLLTILDIVGDKPCDECVPPTWGTWGIIMVINTN
jgi:hypothetical protein